MGLFSKSVKKEIPQDSSELLLSFNFNKIAAEFEKESSQLFLHRNEDGVKTIIRLIELSVNEEVLRVTQVKDQESALIKHGRLKALNDLLAYLTRALSENRLKKESELPQRGAINLKQTKPDPSRRASVAI